MCLDQGDWACPSNGNIPFFPHLERMFYWDCWNSIHASKTGPKERRQDAIKEIRVNQGRAAGTSFRRRELREINNVGGGDHTPPACLSPVASLMRKYRGMLGMVEGFAPRCRKTGAGAGCGSRAKLRLFTSLRFTSNSVYPIWQAQAIYINPAGYFSADCTENRPHLFLNKTSVLRT